MEDMGNGKRCVGKNLRTGMPIYERVDWEYTGYTRNDPIPDEILEEAARLIGRKKTRP